MNFFILIMLFLCLIGLLDKALNNRLGLVESFDKGINSMGSITMSMIGFYCIAITLIQNNVDVNNAIVNIRHNNKIGNKLINKFGNCKYQATTNKINGKLKIPYINPFIKGFKSVFFNDAKKIGNWKLIVWPSVDVKTNPENTKKELLFNPAMIENPLIQNNVDVIKTISNNSSLDPSIIIGSILAPDMGGFSIIAGLNNNSFLVFSGLVLTLI